MKDTAIKDDLLTAVLIGAGNLGWHLGNEMNRQGIKILRVISKSEQSCRKLASALKCDFSAGPAFVPGPVDFVVIAVPDNEIPHVLEQAEFGNSLAVHTAGSVSMDVFEGRVANYGVLYPLMSFTSERSVDFSVVPLLTEGNTVENTEKIIHLASRLSNHVFRVNSARRKIIHLAAVVASNFSNHMYTLAEALLKREGISFDLLKPLIRETTAKIEKLSPRAAQTGPALRKDNLTIEAHLAMLADNPLFADIYRDISKSILTFDKE